MIEGFYLSNWPQGWLYGWRVGDQIGPLRPCPSPNPEKILKEFAPMFGEEPDKLDGLTLFFHHPKGWQLSTRQKDQPGWSVRLIPEEQALAILAGLEKYGHPVMGAAGGKTETPLLLPVKTETPMARATREAFGNWAKNKAASHRGTLIEAVKKNKEAREALTKLLASL